MIVTIAGPSSFLSIAVIDATLRLMREYIGDTILVASNDVAELGRHLVNRTQPHILYHCPEPTHPLMLVFKRAKIPIVIVIDDLYAHLAYEVDTAGTPWHGSFRNYMRLMCVLQPIISDPYFAILQRGQINQTFALWLEQVFGADVPTPALDRFGCTDFSLEGSNVKMFESKDLARSPDAFYASLSDSERREIELALTDYLPTLERRQIEKISWRRQLFSSTEIPFGSTDIRIDTTGKARHLVYGPYFYIPIGTWRAVMRFALENALSGCDLILDVYDIGRNEILFEGEVRTSPKQGAYACEFDFEVVDASSPMEVRVFMKSGSIEGYFVFGDVDLVRIDIVKSHIPVQN